MDTLVIIPARDEEKSIGEVVERTLSCGFRHILVVNDASSDRTAEMAEKSGARVADLPISIGALGAIQTGFRYALAKGYERAVTMDGDGQHEAKYLSVLTGSLSENEVIIGAFPERCTAAKKILIRIFRHLSGLSVNDPTSGFRAYSQKAMETLVGMEGLVLEYQDIGVLLLLKQHGIAIKELPVAMGERVHGRSKIFKNYLFIIKYTLSTLFLIGAKR